MGIKTLCRANLFAGEGGSTLSSRSSTPEPLPHLICQHESIIIKFTHTQTHTHALCFDRAPDISLVQYLIAKCTNRDVVFGWKYLLKMVYSMHNEADAEDYIAWHIIWICIDYLLFDLAAGVSVRMCTVHHLRIPGAAHSWIFLFQCTLSYFLVWNRHGLPSLAGEGSIHGRPASSFPSVRDMRRRRLAKLPVHDLDIMMKTDNRFLPPPAPKPARLFKQQARQSSSI